MSLAARARAAAARLADGLRHGDGRVWLTLAAAALACTFAGPYLTWPRPQADMVVVLDVTQSMEVDDLRRDGEPVTRLAQAKWALAQSLRRLPCGSRVGFGLFTEYRSFLLLDPVEVCDNQRELLGLLARIDGRMAWTGNSEIAKGLYSGLKIVKVLPTKPALVFVTDGHEAPPVHPQYRPSDEGAVRVAPGLIVGVGGLLPARIPKHDLEGRAYGFWAADEVLQVDPRSLGRGGSVSGEQMAEDDSVRPGATVGATPGNEHLSSLREPYLQLLAEETGLQYLRLTTPEALYEALVGPRLAHPIPSRWDLRWVFAVVGLLALLRLYAPSWTRLRSRRQRGGRPAEGAGGGLPPSGSRARRPGLSQAR